MFSWLAIQDAGGDNAQQHPAPGQDEEEMRETREAQETQLEEQYNEAIQAQEEGRHELAKHIYQQILQGRLLQNATAADGLLLNVRYLSTKNTAELLQAEGKATEALHAFARATEIDGGDVVVWLHLGALCEAQGFFRAARYAYERGLESGAEETWECLEGLARVLETLGDWAACLFIIQRALRVDSTHPGLLDQRHRVRRAWNRGAAPVATAAVGGGRGEESQEEDGEVVVMMLDDDDEEQESGDGWLSTAAAPRREKGAFRERTPASVISLTFDAESKSHAWTELGRALLASKEPGLSMPVVLEAKMAQPGTTNVSSPPSSGGGGGGGGGGGSHGKGRRTVRVTEAERLRQVTEAAVAAAAAAAAVAAAAAAAGGGGGGGGVDESKEGSQELSVSSSMAEREDDDASTSQVSESQARRTSRRGSRPPKDKDGGGGSEGKEEKNKKKATDAVCDWVDEHLLGKKGKQQGGGSSSGGNADKEEDYDDDLEWWSTNYSGKHSSAYSRMDEGGGGGLSSPSGGAPGGMFHAAASDEGAELVSQRFRPFKGTHNSLCDVCMDGGELTCCETCSLVYHTGCLFAPPGLSEAFYCDRCREEAYRLAKRRPPRVSDHALFSSQIEEISNDFLPSARMNLGALDVMHRLVLRLARVKEGRIWEDGSLRRVALALEGASRPFARDVEWHSCREPAGSTLKEMDFGPEGELFLAELHLDELLLGPSNKGGGMGGMVGDARAAATVDRGAGPRSKTTATTGSSDNKASGGGEGATSSGSSGSTSSRTGSSNSTGNDSHAAACDLFVSKVLEALEQQKRKKEEKADEDEDAIPSWEPVEEEEEEEVFGAEYLCRFAWLRALLAAWRGDVAGAKGFLKECQGYLEGGDVYGERIEQPHCQRHPCISLEALDEKRKELTERNESGTTRKRVTTFRDGVLASAGGGSVAAAQLYMSIVRTRFLDWSGREVGTTGTGRAASNLRQKYVMEELLSDFLEHEASTLLDTLKAAGGRTTSAVNTFCGVMDNLDEALRRHSSMLMVTLVTCGKTGDLTTAVRLLHQALRHVLLVDPWGDKLVATYLRNLPPGLAARARPDLTRLNVLLLDTLTQLLAMALREGWPASLALPEDLATHLPATLASLLRFSSLPYSRVMLDGALGIYKAIARDAVAAASKTTMTTTTTSSSTMEVGATAAASVRARVLAEVGARLERSIFRSLAGVLCDPQLEPDFLQHYTNTTEARDYCRSALQHFVNLLDEDSEWAVASARGVGALTGRQLRAVVGQLRNLAQMALQNISLYGTTLFSCYLGLTFLVLQHPSLEGEEEEEEEEGGREGEGGASPQWAKLDWLVQMHEALAETGRCGRERGRFLKVMLKAISSPASAGVEGEEEGRAFEATVQCIRCLYNLDLSPDSTAVDHQAGGRAPEGLSETVGLATFVLRYLEEAEDTLQRKKQMLAALLVAYEEEPALQKPEVCSPLFSSIDSYLLRGLVSKPQPCELRVSVPPGQDGDADGGMGEGGAGAGGGGGGGGGLLALLKREQEQAGMTMDVVQEEGEGGRDEARTSTSDSLLHLDALKAKVGEAGAAGLLYVYPRLYAYVGELSPVPKFSKRKGQSESEAFMEYEAANLDLLQMHFLDLRFNPYSLEAWLGLTERAWSLYLMYLDHCPAAAAAGGDSASRVAPRLERALCQSAQRLPQQEGGRVQAGLSVEPFMDIAFFEDVTGTEQGARVCYALKKMGLKHLLTSAGHQLGEEEMDTCWASAVVVAYRVLMERCLQVLDGILEYRLEVEPRDRELATRRIEARVRLAAIAYMRHYEASTAAAPAQPHQQQQQQQLQQQQQEEDQATLSQALANLQAAQALEERYSVRVRRWDIPFMIGKLLVKAGRARHGRHLSYAEIEEAEPGWLDSFLSQFQRAQELAEGSNSCSKMAKKDALYRLHASRLRALLSDHRKVNGVGVVAAPSARMLQVLRRYNTTGREGGERGEEILAEAYLPQLRWKVMMDAMGALATCRRLDSFDHRSIYQRARASEHLLLFVPGSMATRTGGEEATAAEPAAIAEWESERGLSKDTVKALAARTAGERAALSAIAARELMHLLFEKKRTQIVAVWLAEECSNVYELINQRNLKYEATRRRYITYYLSLLQRTHDCDRLLDLHRNVRTLKDPTNHLLHWTQSHLLEYLTTVLDQLLLLSSSSSSSESETMKWLEVAYEVYLDLAEATAAASGRRRGSSQGDSNLLAQQRQALLAKLGGVLVRAYDAAVVVPAAAGNRAEGGGAAALLPTSVPVSTLESALEYGHEKWSDKQGRSKVARGPVAVASKGMKRTLPGSSPVVATSQPGSQQQQQQQQQQQLSPERRSGGGGGGQGGGGGGGGSSPKRRRVLDDGEEEERKEDRMDQVQQGHSPAPPAPPPPPPLPPPPLPPAAPIPSPPRTAEVIDLLGDDDEILV